MLKISDFLPNEKFRIYYNNKDLETNFENYKGKWLILFFYPSDFTFVCPTELEELAIMYDEFTKINAEILSVSTDTVFVHKAWHDNSKAISKIKFPMVADPMGVLCKAFGTYIEVGEDAGLSQRATFLIDPNQKIVAYEMNDNSIGRNAKELFRKLQAAKYVFDNGHKLVCPASWEPGDKTLEPGLDLVGKI